jgi:hypothetical protein
MNVMRRNNAAITTNAGNKKISCFSKTGLILGK